MASVSKRTWTHKGVEKSAWVVRYKDAGGAYRSRQFDLKKPADAYARQVDLDLERGLHVAPGASVTVTDLIAEYLETVEARERDGRRMGRSHATSLASNLRKHVAPYLGALRVSELTWAQVSEWAAALSRNPKLAASSVKRVLHMTKVAFDFAMRREYVHRNLVAEVMNEYRGGRRDPIQSFSLEDIRALFAAAADRPPGFTERAVLFMRCATYLAAMCGLRKGEILGLTWSNIDFGKRLIRVRHNLTDWDELKGPKTRAGIRDVPMPSVVAEALEAWRPHAGEEPRGLIFRTKAGLAFSPPNFTTNHWRPLLERAGLGPNERGWFHFHALRHFAASAMVNAGVPLTEVASLLGHSGFDVTLQVYAHTIAGGFRAHSAVDGIALKLTAPDALTHECLAA